MKTAETKHLTEINLFATLTAKTFYESLGFKPATGKTEIELGGVMIPTVPMSKRIF